jgi:cytochrome bd ubiquinol oxidase subunit II
VTADLTIAVLWVSVTLYAILGGADFGGGLWDLLAGGTARGRRPRALIDHAIGPVWETNHVWLIFDLVILWTAFPAAFAAITSTLFEPLILAVFAIVLRGAGFAFRKSLRRLPLQALTGAIFAFSSVAAPFFMGTAIGAIASGQVPAGGGMDRVASWTGAFPLLTGVLFAGTCAWLAAAYLTVDARTSQLPGLVTYFSRRARAAGVVTGFFAAATLAELHFAAPREFTRLTTGPGLPFVIVSAVAVAIVFALLTAGRTRAVRPFAAAAVTAVIWGWGVAQYPYLLPPSLTVQAGSAPAASLLSILAVCGLLVALVGPGLVLLFTLRGRGKLHEEDERDITEADLPGLQAADAAAADRAPDGATARAGPPVAGDSLRLRELAIVTVGVLAGAALARRRSLSFPNENRRRAERPPVRNS